MLRRLAFFQAEGRMSLFRRLRAGAVALAGYDRKILVNRILFFQGNRAAAASSSHTKGMKSAYESRQDH